MDKKELEKLLEIKNNELIEAITEVVTMSFLSEKVKEIEDEIKAIKEEIKKLED